MRIRTMLGLLVFSVVPSTLAAQGACPSLQAGSTVRLHAPGASSTYVVTESSKPSDTALSVTVPGHSLLSVPCADVQRVQLRTGPARGRSVLRGGGIGLAAGVVLGAALGYYEYENPGPDEWEIFSREEEMALGATLLGGIGLAGGAVIGLLAPGSRWEELPVNPRPARASVEGLRIGPAGGSQVRVSYTLPL